MIGEVSVVLDRFRRMSSEANPLVVGDELLTCHLTGERTWYREVGYSDRMPKQ
jgi:hypothetical protein